MKKLILEIILIIFFGLIFVSIGLTEENKMKPKYNDPALNIAMGGNVVVGKADNGALINNLAIENAKQVKHHTDEAYKFLDGVYVIPGKVINAAFLIAPEGVIVWETGEHLMDGKHYLKEIRKFTDKPIKAVIYSHAHYCSGTTAIIEDTKDVMIIAHPKLNKNIMQGGLGVNFPELNPLLIARAMQQVNNFLPEKGPDARYGIVLDLTKQRGFVPVNMPVENGQILNVAGMDMQFFTDSGSDTNDCVTVWVPSKELVLNNLLWPMMPNLATPRGAKFRDPRYWVKGLTRIRDLEPEYIISQHSIPYKGKENIRQKVNDFMDFLNLVLDQTLRGALKGLSHDQLIDFVALPHYLETNPMLFESYGILSWIPPYIMGNAIGFWDGDASTLYKLPPKDIADRLVPALGGSDKVISLAKDAQLKKEYAWALQLLNYVLSFSPNDSDATVLKGEIMAALGHSVTDSISRSYLLTQARAIQGKTYVPKVIPPLKNQITSEPDKYIYYYRIRIDPIKAENIDKVLSFNFKNKNLGKPALHIRKGVCEYIPDIEKYYRSADITLTLTADSWAELYLNKSNLKDMVDRNEICVDGDLNEALKIFNVFDTLP